MFDHPDIIPLSPPDAALCTWLARGAAAALHLKNALPPRRVAPWLFNTLTHALTQPGAENLWLAVLLDQAGHLTHGHWIIWPDPTDPHHWRSPGRAPFGGPQLAPGLEEAAPRFLLETLDALRRLGGARRVSITLPPLAYGLGEMLHLLPAVGFAETGQLATSLLAVGSSFKAGIRSPEYYRRLKLAQKAGFHFTVESPLALPALLEDLEQWRVTREHRPPPELEALQPLLAQMPEAFPLFAVRGSQHEPIAVALAVWASAQVLYYYLPGSDPAFDNLSPSITLIRGIFKLAHTRHATWLDLGPSLTSEGEPNPNLTEFKRRLGAEIQYRRMYELTW